jgi:hypothetical protein
MARHEPHMSGSLWALAASQSRAGQDCSEQGGHREKALQLVDEAMKEVQQGEAYDQERRR